MNRICLTLLPSALLLSACTVGPDFVPPHATTGPNYAAAADAPLPADQHLALDKPVDHAWWKEFHSAALDGLVAQALQDNPQVTAEKARLAQAQEEIAAAEGRLLPNISLAGAVGSQNYIIGQRTPLNMTLPPFTYYAVEPSGTFPLDLFGGGKRAVEQATALADYQKYELGAAALSLAGNIAAEALQNASARDQIANIKSIVDGDKRDVDLVQTAIDAGSATRTQLLSVQSQLAADRTLLPDFQQQETVSCHALAILVGRAPGGWTAPDFALQDFTLPAEIPASIPSELIHQRPDILAAEARLHAASAAIGVATANLYPQINLSAATVLEALTPGGLFGAGAINSWSVAAGLTQSLFDGGVLSARRRAAIDAYQAALADYQTVVLAAFGQVADDLQSLSNDADRARAEKDAAETAAASLDLSRRSFAAGNAGVLDVIDAERRSAQARLGYSRANAQRLLDTVQLYVAVGGVPLLPDDTKKSDAPAKACCDYEGSPE
jgi:NodT family efflux transporter outer membrane factor (OMF) lipoprotein